MSKATVEVGVIKDGLNWMDNLIGKMNEMDWTVCFIDGHKETTVEIGTYSAAGEDLSFVVDFDGGPHEFTSALKDLAEGFDAEEHAIMWIKAKENGVTGIPKSLREILDDADSIQDMLTYLADTLKEMVEEGEIIND